MAATNPTNPQQPNVTLASVRKAFDQWRSKKVQGGKGKIPKRLWRLVKSLMQHYQVGKITTQLKIRKAQLKREGLLPPSENTTGENQTFAQVELSPLSPLSKPNDKSTSSAQPHITLERACGARLTMHRPSEQQTAQLFQHFFGA